MSLHLIDCTKRLPLPASTKLVLLAFADSADGVTRLAYPGLEAVQEWGSVGRSRAMEIVAELVDLGLLEKRRAGHRGRRAEYLVFPRGCCPVHPAPPADDDLDGDTEGSGVPDPSSTTGSARPDPTGPAEKGSGTADSLSVNGSGVPDPSESVRSTGPSTRKGSGKGPAQRTPSSARTTTPPHPPTADASGGASTSTTTTGCARPGPTPHINCRGCGTTNRQLAASQRRTDAERRRAAAAAQLQADRAARAAGRVSTEDRPAEVVRLLQAVRTGGTR